MASFISKLKKKGESVWKEIFAKRAECDKNGNVITSTYATQKSLNTLDASAAKLKENNLFTGQNAFPYVIVQNNEDILTETTTYYTNQFVFKQGNKIYTISYPKNNGTLALIEDLSAYLTSSAAASTYATKEALNAKANLQGNNSFRGGINNFDNIRVNNEENENQVGIHDTEISVTDGSSGTYYKNGSIQYDPNEEDSYTINLPRKDGTLALTSDTSKMLELDINPDTILEHEVGYTFKIYNNINNDLNSNFYKVFTGSIENFDIRGSIMLEFWKLVYCEGGYWKVSTIYKNKLIVLECSDYDYDAETDTIKSITLVVNNITDLSKSENNIENITLLISGSLDANWIELDVSKYSYLKLIYYCNYFEDDPLEDDSRITFVITDGTESKKAFVVGDHQYPIEVTIEMVETSSPSFGSKYFVYGYGKLIGFQTSDGNITSYSLNTQSGGSRTLKIYVQNNSYSSSYFVFGGFGILAR